MRVLGVLLWPFLPSRAPRILAAVGESADASGSTAPRRRGSGRTVDTSVGPLFPRVDAPRGMIDTHAHLQGLEGGPDAAVEEAAAAGVERIVCIGDSPSGARAAIGLAERHAGVFATAGLHPHRAEAWSEAVRARSTRCSTTRPSWRWGSAGSTTTATGPRDRAGAPSRARSCSPRSGRKPLVIHTREAADDTLAVLRAARTAVVLHCFSLPEHLAEAVERGW